MQKKKHKFSVLPTSIVICTYTEKKNNFYTHIKSKNTNITNMTTLIYLFIKGKGKEAICM